MTIAEDINRFMRERLEYKAKPDMILVSYIDVYCVKCKRRMVGNNLVCICYECGESLMRWTRSRNG